MRVVFLGILIGLVAAMAAACHEAGDVKVLSLSFDGTSAFNESAIKRVLATRSSGWLPWAPKRYFNRAEFEADLKRIVAFYSDRGFPDARITAVDVTFNEAKDGVRLRIGIEEGQPIIVDEVRYEGFEPLPADAKEALPGLPLHAGDRRDREVVRTTRDRAVRLFRDRGYPQAIVDASERPADAAGRVIVTYRADPGPLMTFGPVTVQGVEGLKPEVITRQVAFQSGELFGEHLVARTQRQLNRLQLLEVAVVTPRLEAADDGSVPVTITVAEGPPRRLRLGIGYGTEEQARGTLTWEHLNFYGGAKQATVDAKYSRIEKGLELGLVDPHAWKSGFSSRLGAVARETNQLTYNSQTYGGNASLIHQTEHGPSGQRPVQFRTRVGYAWEHIRYGIRPEFLAEQSDRNERIALGLDPDTGRASGALATIQADFERHGLDVVANPRRGTSTLAHVEFASRALGGTYRYFEFGGELRGFVPAGPAVLAARAQASTIVARDPATVPFSKRYFLGGSSNLRGWSRFEVSPLDDKGRPVGGRSVVSFSAELRMPLPRPAALGLVTFIDAGNVWSGGRTFKLNDLRWAAGAGLRYLTPIGAVRVDAAYQLTPISNLFINGEPSTRRWRLHFSIGHTF